MKKIQNQVQAIETGTINQNYTVRFDFGKMF